jgi:hypothetical protein
VKVPEIDHQTDEIFLRGRASWKMMLFQQPPRSTIGLLERDYGSYTQLKIQPCQDYLRIVDLVLPFKTTDADTMIHPLLEEGLAWFGRLPWLVESYGEIPRSHISYATSTCLRDCDIVFFVRECAYLSGVRHNRASYDVTYFSLRNWLLALRPELVAGQTAIKMPVN